MLHRHLTHQQLTLAAIDDVIAAACLHYAILIFDHISDE